VRVKKLQTDSLWNEIRLFSKKALWNTNEMNPLNRALIVATKVARIPRLA